MAKARVSNFAKKLEENQSNRLGENSIRGAAMLMIDQEIPIQPMSKKTTKGTPLSLFLT